MNLFEQRALFESLRERRNARVAVVDAPLSPRTALVAQYSELAARLRAARAQTPAVPAVGLQGDEQELREALEAFRVARKRLADARSTLAVRKADRKLLATTPGPLDELRAEYNRVGAELIRLGATSTARREAKVALRDILKVLNSVGPKLRDGQTVPDEILTALDDKLKTMETPE